MSDFLAQAIAESTRLVAAWKRENYLAQLQNQSSPRTPLDFARSLRPAKPPAIIAEFKRSSPSRGVINHQSDPISQVQKYVSAGAAAVSILTESKWFGGSLSDIQSTRPQIAAPILRKDFIVDEYDLAISRAVGADAALLIVAALEKNRLADLLSEARQLQLSALVEIHEPRELEIALDAGATIIGVNSRNLRTLEVDLLNALELLARVPQSCTRVFESGIKTSQQVRAALDHGADAILVGEALMQSPDPAVLIADWLYDMAPRKEGSRT